jgi:hypothetical protein
MALHLFSNITCLIKTNRCLFNEMYEETNPWNVHPVIPS